MKQHFCFHCDYCWHNTSIESTCPECGSTEIDVELETADFDDGFYEGDILSLSE